MLHIVSNFVDCYALFCVLCFGVLLTLTTYHHTQRPEIALNMFTEILILHPRSPRAYHGKAQALDQLAEAKRSNQLLVSAISTYLEAVDLPNIPDKLFLRLANRTIDRMRFKGNKIFIFAYCFVVFYSTLKFIKNNI